MSLSVWMKLISTAMLNNRCHPAPAAVQTPDCEKLPREQGENPPSSHVLTLCT